MGNQQERFEKEMAWLTGIIEGEGWVSLALVGSLKKNGRKTFAYTPNIGMTNTDYEIMSEVRRLFENLGIHFRFQTRPAYKGSDGIPRKKKWEISVASARDIKILAKAILPYMIGEKKNRILKLFEFFDIREKKGRGPNSKYGCEEHQIYKELYSYRGKSSSKILNDFTPNMVRP